MPLLSPPQKAITAESKLPEPSGEYAVDDAIATVFLGEDHRFILTGLFTCA